MHHRQYSAYRATIAAMSDAEEVRGRRTRVSGRHDSTWIFDVMHQSEGVTELVLKNRSAISAEGQRRELNVSFGNLPVGRCRTRPRPDAPPMPAEDIEIEFIPSPVNGEPGIRPEIVTGTFQTDAARFATSVKSLSFSSPEATKPEHGRSLPACTRRLHHFLVVT